MASGEHQTRLGLLSIASSSSVLAIPQQMLVEHLWVLDFYDMRRSSWSIILESFHFNKFMEHSIVLF
jgi:hypothetical protein